MAALWGNVVAGWNGGRYNVAPFNPGNVVGKSGDCGRPAASVWVIWGLEFVTAAADVIMTGMGWEAAACRRLASCSGLYSVLSCFSAPLVAVVVMVVFISIGFNADMLGKRCCVGVMVIDEHDARTSMRFGCVVKIGIGCDMGSRPILIRFALSDSFSQARARSCSACTLVKCGGVGRHWKQYNWQRLKGENREGALVQWLWVKTQFQRSWVRISAQYTGWAFFHIYFCLRIDKNNRNRGRGLPIFKKEYNLHRLCHVISSNSVWPDGKIIFQYLSFYNCQHLPKTLNKNFNVGLNWRWIITNPKECSKILFFVKKAKFRQIWSHCRQLIAIDGYIGLMPKHIVP